MSGSSAETQTGAVQVGQMTALRVGFQGALGIWHEENSKTCLAAACCKRGYGCQRLRR